MADPRDQLQQYVSDMCALQRHVHEALETQADDEDVQGHAEAAAAIRSAERVVKRQFEDLEQHLDSIGGDGLSPVKDAVAEVSGFVAGVIGRNRTQQVSKMLRDDFAALNQSAISYQMLDATGRALGSQATCDLCKTHVDQLKPVLREITKAVSPVVARELADDIESLGDVAEAVARETRDLIYA